MKRKAFTLIELLVVIAIIAILAAILFPVFAQAKAAAKATAALSNVKQTALASIMYSGDVDDTFVMGASWNTGQDPIYFSVGCSPWTWLINPYMKSQALVTDPLAPVPPNVFNGNQTLNDMYDPTLGYNYEALAPYYPDDGVQSDATTHVLTSTAVEVPAQCISFSAKWAQQESTLQLGYATAWNFSTPSNDNGPLLNTTIDEPECGTIYAYCTSNWGTNTGGWGSFLNQNIAAGAISGGVSQRNASSAEVSFVDGHAKKLSAGALAAGTNWSPTLPQGNLVVNNIQNYLWFAKPSTNGLQ